MPPQTYPDQPGSDTEAPAAQPAPAPSPSRRSLLRGAAGAGVVGFAAAAGAGVVFAATRPGDATRPADAAKAATTDTAAAKASGEPLVVYLRDTSSGEFEVFNGTSQVRVHNPGLVAQLLDGLQTAQ
jgi:hypothetical protein